MSTILNTGDAFLQPSELRQALLVNGFEPIPADGKRPVIPEWSDGPITAERVERMSVEHADHLNTGLRTGALVGVDIDIWNPEHAAQARRLVEDKLGKTPLVRVGQKGFMLCYRNLRPLRKLVAKGVDDADRTHSPKVEILGAGQQFVAFGVHPGTGKPYSWIGDSDPLRTPFTDLPEVSPDDLQALIPELTKFLRVAGYTAADDRKGKVVHLDTKRQFDPFTIEEIEKMLFCLDPACDRDAWRNIIAATRAAGEEAAIDAWEMVSILDKWSAGNWRNGDGTAPTSYEGLEAVQKVFDTMPPRHDDPHAIGPATLLTLARTAGYSDRPPLAETFSAVIERLETAVPQKRSRYTPLGPKEMRALSPPEYLVDKLIPEGSIVLMYGASQSLKTFLALDLLVSVATGTDAAGKLHCRQGDAVLCAGEAPSAIGHKRWPAIAVARKIADPDGVPFALVPAVPPVEKSAEVEELIVQIRTYGLRPRLLAIDTAARAMRGLNENEAKDAGLLMAAAERLRDEFGCSVIVIHHTPKDTSGRPRGSYVFEADADVVIRVERPSQLSYAIKVECEKLKDEELPPALHLEGRPFENSLVFDVISEEEFTTVRRAASPKPETLEPRVVHRALRHARAVEGVTLTTPQLAGNVLTALNMEQTPRALDAMQRRLRDGAEVRLAAFVIERGGGCGFH